MKFEDYKVQSYTPDQLTPQKKQRILDLLHQLDDFHKSISPYPAKKHMNTKQDDKGWQFPQNNRKGRYHTTLQTPQGQIKGMATVDSKSVAYKNTAAILQLILEDRLRNKGIGRQFLRAVQQQAIDRNPDLQGITIGNLVPNQRASHLYQDQGYEPVSIQRYKKLQKAASLVQQLKQGLR